MCIRDRNKSETNGLAIAYDEAKIKAKIAELPFPLTEAQQRSLSAVSYTHLDVYKRQVQSVTKAVVLITSCVVVRDVKGTQGNLNSTFHLKTCLLYTSRCV